MCVRACVRVRAHSCESDFDSVTCERGRERVRVEAREPESVGERERV